MAIGLDAHHGRLWRAAEVPNKAAPILSRRTATDALLANGLPYSKLRAKLTGHTSCVNALTFSRSGRWLASAGDDPYVHLWDFNQEEIAAPTWRFVGPRSNVFTLAFSASGQYLYSGDTQSDILHFDLSHLNAPVGTANGAANTPSYRDNQHSDSIRAIACHPEQDPVFLSASEDGRIILHDMRAENRRSRAQGTIQQIAPFSCVQYHPTMSQLFATSDTEGLVCLRDMRMAFGPLSQRHHKGVVHKHASFGGLGTDQDSYYAHGSDDFRTYVWKIPDDASLLECRKVVSHLNWDLCPNPGEIGYAQSYTSPRYVPVELSIPHTRLTGHDSIVNSALIHPDRPYLLTAGIERFIRLHSPTSTTPSTEPLPLTPQEVRTVPPTDPNSRQLLLRAMGLIDDPTDEADDDTQAIALFDQILRTEGDGDVFDIRPRGPGFEMSDSEDDSDTAMVSSGSDEGIAAI
ncbi:hypothetical protein ACG7TL_006438 [Trametes sanguinea]